MSGEHPHGQVSSGGRHRSRLTLVFGLVLVVMVAEIVAGLATGSLALLSDAGHMATDALGLGMALAAIVIAERPGGHAGRTYGLYRAEILAALANAVLLAAVAFFVLWEATQRLADPPEVLSGPMLVVALIGLAVNVVGFWMLREGAEESVNVEGALVEVIADLVGSVGVVIAAAVIAVTDWSIVDPLVGAAIGLFILPRAWRLGRKAVRILIQAAPDDVDIDRLRADLSSLDGVTNVHDLHVWTLTSGMPVATVHLTTAATAGDVLTQAQRILAADYGIAHATLQVEPADHGACRQMTW